MPRIVSTASLNDYPKLPISQYRASLNNASPNNTSLDKIPLAYKYRYKEYRYDVAICKTACNYGGVRYWWLCPKCGRRVGVLYCAGAYVCRHCIGARYQSQLIQPIDKLFNKVNKLRHKLAWHGGLAYGIQDKPKGMHQSTYDRLVWEYTNIADKVIFATCQQMGIKPPNN